jgi:hypothetical protein
MGPACLVVLKSGATNVKGINVFPGCTPGSGSGFNTCVLSKSKKVFQMKWFLVKLVYRIVCGEGAHTPQFDEQLRLVMADDESEAFAKATAIGKQEQESFFNQQQQMVQWQFVDVSELYQLNALVDGAEMYSRVNEVEDAEAYTSFVHHKAECIRQRVPLLT